MQYTIFCILLYLTPQSKIPTNYHLLTLNFYRLMTQFVENIVIHSLFTILFELLKSRKSSKSQDFR